MVVKGKKFINLYEDAKKIYLSDELSLEEKHEILFSDRFYGKLNFDYPDFDGNYYEWICHCLVNTVDNKNHVKNKLKMMMNEFERIFNLECKLLKILNNERL